MTTAEERAYPTFLTALLGLIIAPSETSETLLSVDRPKHGLKMILCLVLTLTVPIGIHYYVNGRTLYHPQLFSLLSVAALLGFVFFVIFEKILLRLLGTRVSFPVLTTALTYPLAPLILSIWIVYFVNYIASGSILSLTFLPSGYASKSYTYLAVLPWIIVLGTGSGFLLLIFALRSAGRMILANAFLSALLSFIPLYFGGICGILVTHYVVDPDTINLFLDLYSKPSLILNV